MSSTTNFENFLVSADTPLREVLECIGANAKGVALLAEGRKLIATITDGDIRRGILNDVPLDGSASDILEDKAKRGNVVSVVAPKGDSATEMLELMDRHSIDHLPIVDGGLLCDLVFRADLIAALRVPVSPVRAGASEPHVPAADRGRMAGIEAVLMAGGFGKRLMPLTENLPKPMLPVAGKPILERIVEQVREAGVSAFHFTTHFLPEVIRAHFGDGSRWGVDIRYVHEDEPLGTGGALGRIDVETGADVLLMNGDLLTRLDLVEFAGFHAAEGADLTVGVRQFDMEVPYGVVRCNDSRVEAVEEKPTVPFLVNAGVYMVGAAAREIVPRSGRYDMTDLISDLVAKGFKVSAFPIVEYWMDIGQMQDYRRAEEAQEGWDRARDPDLQSTDNLP